jgi:hypothetical protein
MQFFLRILFLILVFCNGQLEDKLCRHKTNQIKSNQIETKTGKHFCARLFFNPAQSCKVILEKLEKKNKNGRGAPDKHKKKYVEIDFTS